MKRERILPQQLSQKCLFLYFTPLPTSSVYWTELKQKWVSKRNGSLSICQTNPNWCELVSANLHANILPKAKHLEDKYYDAVSKRNMHLNPKRLLLDGLETLSWVHRELFFRRQRTGSVWTAFNRQNMGYVQTITNKTLCFTLKH